MSCSADVLRCRNRRDSPSLDHASCRAAIDPPVLVRRYHPQPGAAAVHLGPRLRIQEIPRPGPAGPARLEILADYDTWITQRPLKSAAAWSSNCSRGGSPARPLDRDRGLLFTEGAAGGSGHQAVRRDRLCGRPHGRRSWPEALTRLPDSPTTQSDYSMPSAMPRCCSATGEGPG